MARYTSINSNIGIINIGTIEAYYPWGSQLGAVLNKDSKGCSMLDLSSAYDQAVDRALNHGYTPAQITQAIQTLNTPKTDISEFYDAIQVLETACFWLWGNATGGGVFFAYDPPNYAPNTITILCSNGLYQQEQNETIYYKFNIGGGTYAFRRKEELYNCFFAYRWNDDMLGLVCTKYDTDAGHLVAHNNYLYNLNTGSYDVMSTTYDWAAINETKPEVLNVQEVPPKWYRVLVIGMDDSNSRGGLSDFGQIFDDQHYDIPGWVHVSGSWTGGDEIPIQPPYDPSKEQGGVDDYQKREDNTKYTDDDQFSVDGVNSGLVTIFRPEQQDIRDFSNFLFSGITEDIAAFFKRLMSNPLDYVISLAQVHYTPPVDGTAEIKFGGIGSGVVSWVVNKQFQILQCGTNTIQRQWGSFLDYGGYTKARLYLPYCGTHEIDIDLTQDADISIQYIIDNLSGACVAQVIVNHASRYDDDRTVEGMRYEFTGNVFEMLPLSAADYRSAVQGALTAIGGVGAIAQGNPVSGAAAIASGVMAMKPTIQQASHIGSNFGYMGNQKPFIEVIRPNPSVPLNKPYREGYPANIYVKLSDVSDYTEVERGTFIPTHITYATDEEIQEITKLLESGVIM